MSNSINELKQGKKHECSCGDSCACKQGNKDQCCSTKKFS